MTRPNAMRRTVLGGLAVSSFLPQPWGHASARPLKATALYSWPFEQLWVSRIHGALKQAQHKGWLEYTGFENIYKSEYFDLVRAQAASGVDVIFGESYAHEAEIRKIAAEFPNVAFVWSSANPPQAPNLSIFDNYIYEPAYLAGMLAAEFSHNKHIGVVAGFDMPDIRQIIHAFFAGAKAIDPSIQTHAGVINNWYHLMRAQRMTHALADQGVDVVLAITHIGVVETAAQRGILAINCMANQQEQYPDTVITAVMWNMDPVVKAVVQRLRNGTYQAESYEALSLMKAGGSELAPLGSFQNKASPQMRALLAHKTADIIQGKFVVPKDSSAVTLHRDS